MKKICLIIAIFLFVTNHPVYSQRANDLFNIDKNGRMTWKESGKESFFWGVNYTTPFAHAYRQIAKLGKNRKEVIDSDTYHLSRMGINAYRIHVWDCEITDSLGNLLQNDHLDLFDYLVYRFQQRGVYIFLTPIAYWGNGYPEQNEKLPGFSGNFSKGNVYTEPAAITAQERYLKQFINHINPYTRKAYKNDPMVVGFEVCNEPGHSKAKETTRFVKKMKAAIRSTGCKKPVFYNVTQSINLLEDFIKGGTDGVTFQWYPSGLVANHEMKGNFLPHVDKYDMPFSNEYYFKDQARFVYEFDAADIGRSYMYPPMALSFKEAGMQWVTMFAYDPVAIASINTEYQTHFLNLAYAPQKALGFKIAGELFRNPEFKRDRESEKYPFDIEGVKISYTDDLSELATDKLFYYTNNTVTRPPNSNSLKSIAGYGTSPVVSYNGYGAYFLDKIEDGVWRLEIMPDALWVRDPFSRATPRIENVVIKWEQYEMEVDLPNLGKSFQVIGVNDGNNRKETVNGGKFIVIPGVYILSKKPVDDGIKNRKIGDITVSEFYAPEETINKTYFFHKAPVQVSEGQPVEVVLKVISPVSTIKNFTVRPSVRFSGTSRRFRRIKPPVLEMEMVDKYTYKAIIPDSFVTSGTLNYTIIEKAIDGKTVVYPGGVEGPVSSWEYYNPETYSVKVLPAGAEVELFNAGGFASTLSFQGDFSLRSNVVQSGVEGKDKLQFTVVEGRNYSRHPDNSGIAYAIENYIGDEIKGIAENATNYSSLAIVGKAGSKPVKIKVNLIDKNGDAFTSETSLVPGSNICEISLNEFLPGKMLLLPRPYPGFLPLWYSNKNKNAFSLSSIEKIQIIIPKEGNENLSGFELNSVILK